MQLRVLLFAAARDLGGGPELLLDLAEDARATDVIQAAVAARPALARISAALRVAVNQAFVGEDAQISAGDEVALLPPVSGGSRGHLRVLDDGLELDRVIAAVSDEEHGAIATFSGVVRRRSHGHLVTRLDYEAYVPMAERAMRALVAEIVARRPTVRIAIEHRVGALSVGELAVVIAVGAPHRRDALAACEEAIDTLKATVPIWKREHTASGAEWVGCDGCAPASSRENERG